MSVTVLEEAILRGAVPMTILALSLSFAANVVTILTLFLELASRPNRCGSRLRHVRRLITTPFWAARGRHRRRQPPSITSPRCARCLQSHRNAVHSCQPGSRS